MSNSVYNEIFGVIGVVVFIAWCADIPPIASQEVATYTAACYSSRECKPAEYDLSRSVYRADISTRTVTSWMKDGGDDVYIYKDCAIRDKKNWRCQIDDNTALFKTSMHDGQVNQLIEVPWYKWWWLRMQAYLSKK